MTVLHRVETLGRSYRQSLWRCGAVASTNERYLGGYPKSLRGAASSALPLSFYSCQSFSTSSSSDDIRTVSSGSATAVVVPQVLQVASTEARQVISRAPKASSSTSSSSPKEAAEACQAMLALTSRTKPLAEAIMENKAKAEQVACLHQALIAVTSWCISLTSLDASLVTSALDLGRRAHDLSLPLHLPLYRSLVTAIAQYSEEENVVDAILETANLAVSALSVTLQESFFSDALLSLVRQQKLQDAITLRKTMKERYDIDTMDSRATLDILQALHENVQAFLDNPEKSNLDEDATIELFRMLRKTLNITKKQLLNQAVNDSLADMLATQEDEQALTDALQQLDETDSSDDDDDESDLDSDGDYDDDDKDSLVKIMDEIVKTEQKIAASLEDLIKRAKAVRSKLLSVQVNVNAETGDIEGFNVSAPSVDDTTESSSDDDEEESDELTKEMVYLRDSSAWMLPDVTQQLVKLNGGRDVFYTRKYEAQILREVIDSHGNDY